MRPNEEPVAGAPDELPSEAVARRAYEIYLEREPSEDRQLEDWLRAEAELRREEAPVE